jgi:hypothetical protein
LNKKKKRIKKFLTSPLLKVNPSTLWPEDRSLTWKGSAPIMGKEKTGGSKKPDLDNPIPIL